MTVKQQYVLIDGVWEPTGGPPGERGPRGIQGEQGLQGEVAVDPAAVTGAAGSSVVVTDLDPSPNKALLKFTVPKGDQGIQGIQGDQGIQGPQGVPGDLSKAKADTLYEPKSELLKEAAWYVDAGVVGTGNDRLLDITGRGRDAVFGAGAAAPAVLSHSGEDHIHIPANAAIQIAGGGLAMLVPTASVITMDLFIPTGNTSGVFPFHTADATGGVWVQMGGDGSVIVGFNSGAGNITQTWAAGTFTVGARHTFVVTLTSTTANLAVDGVDKSTKTFSQARPAPASVVGYIGLNLGGAAASYKVYSVTVDGTHRFDPRNVSADYSTIANTGSAGGTWTINRAATGYKTTVVDRPLLLFGGGQYAKSSGMPQVLTADSTILVALRRYGAAASPQEVVFDSGASGALTAGIQVLHNLNGYVYIQQKNGAANVTLSTGLTFGSGQQITGSRVTGTNLQGIVRGVISTGTTAVAKPWGNHTDWNLGAFNGNVYPANMELIAAAVFDRALTDAEIAEVSLDLAGVPHDKQPDPHSQYVLESTVGNLLTENQASGTDALGTTAGFNPGGAATLSRSTTGAIEGTGSLKVTGTQAAAWGMDALIPLTGLVVGQPYTAIATFKSVSGGRPMYIGTSSQISNTRAEADGVAHQVSWTFLPAATTENLYFTTYNWPGAAGDSFLVDRISFHKGAGGAWAMPGTPITGLQSSMEQVTLWADLPASGNWLGRKIQVTSGLGFLVALWNGTAWVVAPESDTGMRTISTLLNGWAPSVAGWVWVRRLGNMVTGSFYLNGAAATSPQAWAPLTGWAPQGSHAGAWHPAGRGDQIGAWQYESTGNGGLRLWTSANAIPTGYTGIFMSISVPTTDAWPATAP